MQEYEVPQQLRDVDLEIQVADRRMTLKRKTHEMSDLDHQQQLKQTEDQLKLDRQQFELRKEQEQWEIDRQTQLLDLEIRKKQALSPQQ